MNWAILYHREFADEFESFSDEVKEHILARGEMLETVGPTLGRPFADTLKGSKHGNMKELRFNADNGVWRVAYAFDSARNAILLVAGDKAGVSQDKFYTALIQKADKRYDEHLAWLAKTGGK